MTEVLATKEKMEVRNSGSLPETRVWGSKLSGTACIGAWSWLSSTMRPGCATTNQIQGVFGLNYDNNGNELYGGVAYDAENRILTAPGVEYAYDSRNKRVWKGTFSGSTLTAQEAYFCGVDGQKLGTYSLTLNGTQLTATTTQTAVFFGGKRVAVNGAAFVPDRLGSNTAGKYFPYGEDRGADRERSGEVRHVHSGFSDGAGLCRSALLLQSVRQVHDGGPVPGYGDLAQRSKESTKLESLFIR